MSDLLDRLRELIRQKSYASALSLCDEAFNSSDADGRARVWRLRSYVHRDMGRYDLAVQDASAGLAEHPQDLALLLDRAASYIELTEFASANKDLELLLRLESTQGGNYFGTTALMLQAICLTRLGLPERALLACDALGSDARMWALGKLWTREDLIEAARGAMTS